jgi:hypothetical protein
MASTVSICNEALAEIAADAIASMDEASVAARECVRAFDSVVSDLLERGSWGFKTRRSVGSPITNDRPEWNYAYSKPSAASKVLRVLIPIDTSYPEWGAFTTPMWDGYGPVPFAEVGGTVYTNLADAIIEYTAATVDVSVFPALFRRAVALELGARIAYPIKKDRQLRGDMIQLAELAVARAIADDENRYPRQRQEYISEAEKARAGYC